MRIATDVDMVLLDFDVTWRQAAEACLQQHLPPVRDVYRLKDRYGLSEDQAQAVWAYFHAEDYWDRCHPIPESVAALQDCLAAGYEVHAVSAIASKDHASRTRQLAALGLSGVTLHATGSADISKESLLRTIQPAFYADDCWSHCHEARQAGVPYVVFIETFHDGQGQPSPHISKAPSLAHALAAYRALECEAATHSEYGPRVN